MFDTLSDRLQGALGDLRKRGRLDEEAISRAMREVRLALLEADVNFDVVKDFVARVREQAVGQEVLKSVTPGQQVVKIVHDELTALMGSGDSRLAFASAAADRDPARGPAGLGQDDRRGQAGAAAAQGGPKPGLVAADLQRPAAVDQLQQLGSQIDVPVYTRRATIPSPSRGAGSKRPTPTASTPSSSTRPAGCTSTRS